MYMYFTPAALITCKKENLLIIKWKIFYGTSMFEKVDCNVNIRTKFLHLIFNESFFYSDGLMPNVSE